MAPWGLIGTETSLAGTGALNTAVTASFSADQPRSDGNLLVCWVGTFGNAASPSPGTGWNAVVQQSNGGVLNMAMWIKQATGGDAAPSLSANASQGYIMKADEFGYGYQARDAWGSASGTGTSLAPTLASGEAQAQFLNALLLAGLATNYSAAPGTYTPGIASTIASSLHDTNNNGTSTTFHVNFTWGLTTSQATGSPTAITYSSIPATPTAGSATAGVLFPLPVVQRIHTNRMPLG